MPGKKPMKYKSKSRQSAKKTIGTNMSMKGSTNKRKVPPKVFPQPKRGKARAHLKKRPVIKKPKSVPYVRHGKQTAKSRPEQEHWKRTLKGILQGTEFGTIEMLKQDGILDELRGTTCQKCQTGVLGPLKWVACKKGWYHRCRGFGCQQYALPQQGNPLFPCAYGSAATPLKEQAAILFCGTVGISVPQCHKLIGANHKAVEGMYNRLDQVREKFVMMQEPKIKFGSEAEWNDIEADEVDLRKFDDPNDTSQRPREWEQWGGVVERGFQKTLVLNRLNPGKTSSRSPGPGPIKKIDWTPFARKRLSGRKVILHTDGARTYKVRVPGVLHDYVVHKKKRVTMGGQHVWLKPKFTKVTKHELPNGRALWTKAGTQIIDRFWSSLRSRLKDNSSRVASAALRRRVRSAQWLFWHRGEDLWLQLGQSLKALRSTTARD